MKKRFEKLSEEERKNVSIIILIIYGILFIVFFSIIFTHQEHQKNNTTNAYKALEKAKNPFYKEFNDLVKTNNYKYEFNLNNTLTLTGEKDGSKEHIVKLYNGVENEYLINENYYLEKIYENYTEVTDVNLTEDLDDIPLNTKFIYNLLLSSSVTDDTTENNIRKITSKVKVKKVLEYYNDLKYTNYETENSDTVYIIVKIKKGDFLIDLKLTPLYKVINNTDINVDYKLKFYDKNKVKIKNT